MSPDARPAAPVAAARSLGWWLALATLVTLAAVLQARWLQAEPEVLRLGLFRGLGDRASMLPLLQAGLATCLAAGTLCLGLVPGLRRLPAPLLALLFLGLSGSVLEWSLRQYARAEIRPSPTLIWELDPKGPGNNRFGMRYPDLPAKSEPAEFRVLVLGDSSAWGDRLERVDQRFSDVLERLLRRAFPKRRVRVLNAAVPGYSTFQMEVALRQKYLALQPDLLVLSTNSDWPRESRPDRERLPAVWLRPVLAVLDTSEVYLCLLGAVQASTAGTAEPGPTGPRVPAPESQANLEAMIQSVQARGGSAVVLNMPVNLARYQPGESVDLQPRNLHAWRRQARAAARNTGSAFLDLDTEWRLRHGGDLDPLFLDLVHPSPRGHQEIAERLFQVIRSQTGGG